MCVYIDTCTRWDTSIKILVSFRFLLYPTGEVFDKMHFKLVALLFTTFFCFGVAGVFFKLFSFNLGFFLGFDISLGSAAVNFNGFPP